MVDLNILGSERYFANGDPSVAKSQSYPDESGALAG